MSVSIPMGPYGSFYDFLGRPMGPYGSFYDFLIVLIGFYKFLSVLIDSNWSLSDTIGPYVSFWFL